MSDALILLLESNNQKDAETFLWREKPSVVISALKYKNNKKETFLHVGAKLRMTYADLINTLRHFSEHIDFFAVDDEGKTAFEIACMNKNTRMIEFILEFKSNFLNAQGSDGSTLLHHAVKERNTINDFRNILAKHSKNLSFKTKNNANDNPLELALKAKNTWAIHFILKSITFNPENGVFITAENLSNSIVNYGEYKSELLNFLFNTPLNKNQIHMLTNLVTENINNFSKLIHEIKTISEDNHFLPPFAYSASLENPEYLCKYLVEYEKDEEQMISQLTQNQKYRTSFYYNRSFINSCIIYAHTNKCYSIEQYFYAILSHLYTGTSNPHIIKTRDDHEFDKSLEFINCMEDETSDNFEAKWKRKFLDHEKVSVASFLIDNKKVLNSQPRQWDPNLLKKEQEELASNLENYHKRFKNS